jgi:hypothetical protein
MKNKHISLTLNISTMTSRLMKTDTSAKSENGCQIAFSAVVASAHYQLSQS